MKKYIYLLLVLLVLAYVAQLSWADENDATPKITMEELTKPITTHEVPIATFSTCWYEYAPKKDITVHELALLLPYFMNRDLTGMPEEVKRHVIEHCN